MANAFGELVRAQLRNLGLTQRRLAEQIREVTRLRTGIPADVTQPIISNWLTGRPPDSDDPRIEALASVLGIPMIEIRKAIGRTPRDQELIPSIPDFVEVEQLHVVGPGTQVWVFTACQLNLDDVQREAWVKNLLQGVEYHIVWVLDVGDRQTLCFENDGELMDRIIKAGGSDPRGRIHHYVTSIYGLFQTQLIEGQTHRGMNNVVSWADFQAFRERHLRPGALHFPHVFHDPINLDEETRISLARLIPPQGFHMLYLKPTGWGEASLWLERIQTKPGELAPRIVTAFWLTDRPAIDLLFPKVVQGIRERIDQGVASSTGVCP